MEFHQLAAEVRAAKERYQVALTTKNRIQKSFLEAVDLAQDSETARQLIQAAATEAQDAVLHGMVDTCNHALAAIFGDRAYTLRAKAVPARGKTEVDICFVSPGGFEVDPLTASGGGAVDVAAFALRVAAVLMSRPPARAVLVMDEPFKFLSVEYREAAATLLQELSENLGFQFILVTHIPELAVGHVVRLSHEEDADVGTDE